MADQKTNYKSNDPAPPSPPAPLPGGEGSPAPLTSVYTNNLPAILDHFGISLAVSTYQAGKVILVRSDGGGINTHFRDFNKPMGLAVDGQVAPGQTWYYWLEDVDLNGATSLHGPVSATLQAPTAVTLAA